MSTTWVLSNLGQSCEAACESSGYGSCGEEQWPSSKEEFEQIVAPMGAVCSGIHMGGTSKPANINPARRIAHGSLLDRRCYWDSDYDPARCSGALSNYQRFCPCTATVCGIHSKIPKKAAPEVQLAKPIWIGQLQGQADQAGPSKPSRTNQTKHFFWLPPGCTFRVCVSGLPPSWFSHLTHEGSCYWFPFDCI